MYSKKIFVDTNILIDIIYLNPTHQSDMDSVIRTTEYIIKNKNNFYFYTSSICILEIYNNLIKKANKGQKQSLKETRNENKEDLHNKLILGITALTSKYNIRIDYDIKLDKRIFENILDGLKFNPMDTNDYINLYAKIIPKSSCVLTNDKDFYSLNKEIKLVDINKN